MDGRATVAEMIPDGESPLPNTEVHRLRSEQVGDDFKVLIGHAGTEPEGPRRVLVMADPWAGSGTADEMTRILHLNGQVPDMVVVAVGATHVLLTAPTTFCRYAIGSPSLWWDDGAIFAREEACAAANDDLPAQIGRASCRERV